MMITAGMLQSSLRRHPAPLVLALVIGLCQLGGAMVREALQFDRSAIGQGQWWRLLTNCLVHLGPYHCLLNLLGLAALLVLCPEPLRTREWLRRLVSLAVGTSLLLYAFTPDLETYVGFSGALHGLFLLGLVPMARRGDLIAGGCLLYLFGKLAFELWAGAPVSDEQAIGGRVVTESHLFGTLAALVYGALAGTFGKRPDGGAAAS